jgi:hypothetical protein
MLIIIHVLFPPVFLVAHVRVVVTHFNLHPTIIHRKHIITSDNHISTAITIVIIDIVITVTATAIPTATNTIIVIVITTGTALRATTSNTFFFLFNVLNVTGGGGTHTAG